MNAKEIGLEAVYPNDGFGQFPPWAGITLRQHYAGLAMQRSLSGEVLDKAVFAAYCVGIADALIAELCREQ